MMFEDLAGQQPATSTLYGAIDNEIRPCIAGVSVSRLSAKTTRDSDLSVAHTRQIHCCGYSDPLCRLCSIRNYSKEMGDVGGDRYSGRTSGAWNIC